MSALAEPAPGPLYLTVAARLRDRIGPLAAGERLPTEPDLARQLGVSRVTLRRAISLLLEEGLVVRLHGVGTFVAGPRLVQPLIGLHSMRDLMDSYNASYAVEIRDREVGPATPAERRRLDLGSRASVLRYFRHDFVESLPVSVAQVTVPASYSEHLDVEALRQHSLYGLLEGRCGIRVVRAQQTVRADAAGAELAGHLGLRRGHPVLVLDRIGYGQDGVPVEWGVLSYRYDRVECSVELLRHNARGGRDADE